MKKGREIISLPIHCQETNCNLGEVKDLIYDFKANRALALVAEQAGWLKGAKLIKYEDTQLGPEQIIVKQAACLKNGKHDDEARQIWDNRQSLFGSRLFSPTGEVVGIIADTILDETTGTIIGYELSNGVADDLLTGRRTLMLDQLEAQKYQLETELKD